MDGEDVFGQKITATIISPEVIGFSQSSPIKCEYNTLVCPTLGIFTCEILALLWLVA